MAVRVSYSCAVQSLIRITGGLSSCLPRALKVPEWKIVIQSLSKDGSWFAKLPQSSLLPQFGGDRHHDKHIKTGQFKISSVHRIMRCIK
jgi:hypothetical protein